MKKAVCVISFMVVCGALAAQAGDLVSGPTPPAQPVHRTQGVQYWTLDYVTGAITAGQQGSRAELVYDNTANSTGSAAGTFEFDEAGDDMIMTGGGLLQELGLSIVNFSDGDLTAIDLQVNFLDYDLIQFGTFSTTLTYPDPLPPGYASFWTISNLGGEGIVLPTHIIVTQILTNPQGTGIAWQFGQAIYEPTVLGDSGDSFILNFGWYWFTANPTANLYYSVAVDLAPGDVIVAMTGAWRGVTFNAGVTNLGFSSGKVGAFLQRWSAIPIHIASDTTVKFVDLYWFEPADSTADNILYKIWHRTGLNKPVQADEFAAGTLGPYVGLGDGPVGWHHGYVTDIPLPAGDYYFTMYADGGDPTHDWNAAWFCGAGKQDEALEQDFMWRSTTYPAPGFAVYAPASVQPGPTMTDAQDVWNTAFFLWGTAPAAGCQGDFNCDGLIDFNDIDPFVAVLSGQNCCDPTNYNCDVNGNGSVGFDDIDPFVALLSSGAICP